jgi:hypothetical protein
MPMMFNSQETQQESEQQQERRYDPDTLRKVTALATRLQHDHHERLTASQMESIGLEVGLEPEFIQQAIVQLEEEHARMEAERQRLAEEKQQSEDLVAQRRKVQEQAVMTRTEQRLETSATKAEFYSVCAALTAPMLFGLMAYYFKSGSAFQPFLGQSVIAPRAGAMQLFTMISPWPLALMLGFAAGKKRVGFVAAATLILALAPTVPFLAAASPEQYQEILRTLTDHVGEMFLYAMLALPVACTLGVAGAWIRQQYFPFPAGKSRQEGVGQPVQHKEYTVSRPEMVSLLHNMQPAPGMYGSPYMQAQPQPYLQAQMPSQVRVHPHVQQVQPHMVGQKERRAFVSVDVAGLAELRQSATLVAVDYSFGQLRAWIEEIVKGNGGELQAGADGSLLASFPTDGQGVRAARQLQERLPQFNKSLNRLPLPFRLRCGLSAGETANNAAIERSQALLRTADGGDTLISSELGATALAEMGQLTPLPGSLMGDMAFVWRMSEPSSGPPQ